MLTLYFEAPFATFRTFTAGSFRPTAAFLTPSAAYGLLLNIAGIDMRYDDGKSAMTLIRTGLPVFSVAIAVVARNGKPALPTQQSILQQLHNYKVGESAKIDDPLRPGSKITIKGEGMRRAKGNKYNIGPARRAILSDIRGYVAADADPELERRIADGLSGQKPRAYGLPFLGDNSFLLDRLTVVSSPINACWYVRVSPDGAAGMRESVTRMTISIDREDMSKTMSALFEPLSSPSSAVPDAAWVRVGAVQ